MKDQQKTQIFEQDITDRRMVSAPKLDQMKDRERPTNNRSKGATEFFEQDIQVR